MKEYTKDSIEEWAKGLRVKFASLKYNAKKRKATKSKPWKRGLQDKDKKTKQQKTLKPKRIEQISPPKTPVYKAPIKRAPSTPNSRRLLDKLGAQFLEPNLDINLLKKTCWLGVPAEQRALAWKLLLGYLPPDITMRSQRLHARRKDYASYVNRISCVLDEDKTSWERDQLIQIQKDIPRDCPNLFKVKSNRLEQVCLRALCIWCSRHRASGYVQGMVDIMSVFLYLFIDDYLRKLHATTVESKRLLELLDSIPEPRMLEIEADAYWCYSQMMGGIMDNYTENFPGLQKMLLTMKEVVDKVDTQLGHKMESFAFGGFQPEAKIELKESLFPYYGLALDWMLMHMSRDLPAKLVLRLWDTYLCQGRDIHDGFSVFHSYVCAAFLIRFSSEILAMDGEGEVKMFFKELPGHNFTASDMDELLAKAFEFHSMFHHAKSHFAVKS